MAETRIVTKSGIEAVSFALDELNSGLAAHIQASLAKAHGFTALYFSGPLLDVYGNDLQYYRDSNGDIVGTHQLRISVNNTVYYAPATITTFLGQHTSDSSLTEDEVSAFLAKMDRSAWVTEFGSATIEMINATRDAVLLPHTRLSHWESHAPLTVFPKVTKDSKGHTVGNYVAVIQFNGIKYELPCEPRLGGPIQPPRVTLSSYYLFNDRTGDNSFAETIGPYTVTATVAGTGPFTFVWYGRVYSNTGIIVDTSDGQILPPGTQGLYNLNGFDTVVGYTLNSTANTSTFRILDTLTKSNYADLKVWYYPKVTSVSTGVTTVSAPFVYESIEDT